METTNKDYELIKFNEFMDTLLPGNYALTKSMELTKLENSGTLWYMKKFIVWYYYILLSDINKIKTNEYVDEVTSIFESFIKSMDADVREDAYKYFFPLNELINLKSREFKTFSSFLGNMQYEDQRDKVKKELDSRKYYFVFLMEIGGQSGNNKKLKDFLYSENFSMAQIDEIIMNILGENFSKQKANSLKNDYHASLRNERQLLYYYGYFHSKSSGSKDVEFSSLTPVGELAIMANYDEFACIYEMQKLKMISQPISVTIDKIPPRYRGKSNFQISYSPYLDILNHLDKYGEMSLDEYRYIVSRFNGLSKKRSEDKEVIMDKEIIDGIERIKEEVDNFGRESDTKNEDFDKELKKYILGIRGDLALDKGTHVLSLVELKNSKLKILAKNIFEETLNMYRYLNDYKIMKYGDLFALCEDELNNQYNNKDVSKVELKNINAKLKNRWNLYNINIENFIILGVIVNYYSIKMGCKLNDIVTKYIDDFRQSFAIILKRISLSTKKDLTYAFDNLINYIENKTIPQDIGIDYSYFNIDQVEILPQESADDLFNKIRESSKTDVVFRADRKRNIALIRQIKAYYILKYTNNKKMLSCESCGQSTFLTENNEPYIEFHHLIPFGLVDGPDHYLNIYGLCPNCHRKIHNIQQPEKKSIYENIDNNNHLREKIVERLKELDNEGYLKSYHLEFLLAEDAITEEEYNNIAIKN